MCDKRDTRGFSIVRVMHGENAGMILRAKLNFILKPKGRAYNDRLLKQIEANKYQIQSVCNQLVSNIYNLSYNVNLKSISEDVYEVCSNILGFTEKYHQNLLISVYGQVSSTVAPF